MVAQRKEKPPVRPRRKVQCVKIAVNVLAAMYEMDNPLFGIIGAVAEDEHENVPAIFDGNSGKYVNLLTGEMSTLDAKHFAFTAEVWYMPRCDAFSFIISGKCMAKVNRLELVKVFGKDVIVDLKVKLR